MTTKAPSSAEQLEAEKREAAKVAREAGKDLDQQQMEAVMEVERDQTQADRWLGGQGRAHQEAAAKLAEERRQREEGEAARGRPTEKTMREQEAGKRMMEAHEARLARDVDPSVQTEKEKAAAAHRARIGHGESAKKHEEVVRDIDAQDVEDAEVSKKHREARDAKLKAEREHAEAEKEKAEKAARDAKAKR